MIANASDAQIASALRDVDTQNPAHVHVAHKLRAEQARRAQFQNQGVKKQGFAAITANVFAQRTTRQTPAGHEDVLIQEQEVYGVPERLIEQQRQTNVVNLPKSAIHEVDEEEEEEQPVPKPQGIVSTPRNLAAKDEQTGSMAAIGSGGIKNQKPTTEQEESAMMYGYANPMSFGISVNTDKTLEEKTGEKVLDNIKDDEDSEESED
jgi:hypothetical protein